MVAVLKLNGTPFATRVDFLNGSLGANPMSANNGPCALADCQRAEKLQPPVPAHLQRAMALLMEGYEYSIQLQRDVWHFAIEVCELREALASNSDLRWLMAARYVDHAWETTGTLDHERTFENMGALAISDRSCFVCTPSGMEVAAENCQRRSFSLPTAVKQPANPSPASNTSSLPRWDRSRGQLRFAERIVKEFKLPAPNQETILSVFEEEGWPPRIDDPLPPCDVDPRRRLHDTIKGLNGRQKYPALRFMGDGSGEGVR